MALSKKELTDDEDIVIDLHPHWWYLVPRGALLVLTLALGIWVLAETPGEKTPDSGDFEWWGQVLKFGSAVLVAAALLIFVARLIQWTCIDFVVTTERCIYRAGVFQKEGKEFPLDRLTAVFFNQTFFERIVGAGDIGLESAGEGSRQSYSDIRSPKKVQHLIEVQRQAYDERKNERLGTAIGGGARQFSIADEIARLEELRQQGVITDEEFATQRARLLA